MHGKDNEQSLERSTSSNETLNSSREKNQQQQANKKKNITVVELKKFLEGLQLPKLSNEQGKALYQEKNPSVHWKELKDIVGHT